LAPGTICARGCDARRKLAGERDVAAVFGAAEHERWRHRDLAQPPPQIDRGELPQRTEEGRLAHSGGRPLAFRFALVFSGSSCGSLGQRTRKRIKEIKP
jgi:hypothetical protein